MMLRDARGVVHDLGPRRVFSMSQMPLAPGYGEEATGGWKSHAFLFNKADKPAIEGAPAKVYKSKTEYNREHRAANIESYRAAERVRRANYRAAHLEEERARQRDYNRTRRARA